MTRECMRTCLWSDPSRAGLPVQLLQEATGEADHLIIGYVEAIPSTVIWIYHFFVDIPSILAPQFDFARRCFIQVTLPD